MQARDNKVSHPSAPNRKNDKLRVSSSLNVGTHTPTHTHARARARGKAHNVPLVPLQEKKILHDRIRDQVHLIIVDGSGVA